MQLLNLLCRQAVKHHDHEVFAREGCFVVGKELVDEVWIVLEQRVDESSSCLDWQ
ncbi:hypothetical protein D3C76_1734970 [compost metagenome]